VTRKWKRLRTLEERCNVSSIRGGFVINSVELWTKTREIKVLDSIVLVHSSSFTWPLIRQGWMRGQGTYKVGWEVKVLTMSDERSRYLQGRMRGQGMYKVRLEVKVLTRSYERSRYFQGQTRGQGTYKVGWKVRYLQGQTRGQGTYKVGWEVKVCTRSDERSSTQGHMKGQVTYKVRWEVVATLEKKHTFVDGEYSNVRPIVRIYCKIYRLRRRNLTLIEGHGNLESNEIK